MRRDYLKYLGFQTAAAIAVSKIESMNNNHNNQLMTKMLEEIELKAEHEAALQFHPFWSPDQNTACRICYRNGAKEYLTKLIECDKPNSALEEKNRQLMELLEKNFKDYLECHKCFTPQEIEQGWVRYKVINNL
jgi:hypothetical protein